MNEKVYFIKFLTDYKNYKSGQVIQVDEEKMWDHVFDSKTENYRIIVYKSLGIMDIESIET
jgi:hypothetical protein